MKAIAATALLLALSGCSPEYVAEHRCKRAGLTTDTGAYWDCYNRKVAEEQRGWAALAAMDHDEPVYRAPVFAPVTSWMPPSIATPEPMPMLPAEAYPKTVFPPVDRACIGVIHVGFNALPCP